MTPFTIETEYMLPVYRQKTYEADTLEAACAMAIEDDDWDHAKESFEGSGATYVSGAWEGADNAYGPDALPVPEGYGDETTLAERLPARFAEVFRALVEFHDGADDGGAKNPVLEEARALLALLPQKGAPTEDDEGYPPPCSNPGGHEWPNVEEHEAMRCVHCGADGDA